MVLSAMHIRIQPSLVAVHRGFCSIHPYSTTRDTRTKDPKNVPNAIFLGKRNNNFVINPLHETQINHTT